MLLTVPNGMIATQMSSDLGSRLELALRHRGLKQADLARILGLSTATVSRYVGGSRSRVDAGVIGQIADALGVSNDWLSRGKGAPNYDPAWRRPAPVGEPAPSEGAVGAAAWKVRPSTGVQTIYPERHRALVLLRPHLDDRAREYLLSLEGPPYEAWDLEMWIAEAERVRERLADLDAKWGPRPKGDAS